MEIGIILVIAAVVLVIVAFLLSRVGRATGDMVGTRDVEAEPVRPRPKLAEFHVRGEEAQVFFEVPLGSGEVDQALAEVLVNEAVEVVREKRHTLPIADVTIVVAFGRRDGEFVRAGHVKLEEPGELPPPQMPTTMIQFGRAGYDPLEQQFAEGPGQAPGLAETTTRRELAAIGQELRIPGTVETGLRSQGVDPASMNAGDLVLALLELSGYAVAPAEKDSTYFATRGGLRTYLRVVPHQEGEYQELDEGVIDEFVVDFVSSGADRGLLVTDKYGPFVIHSRERREPRVRFVTRERLQNFVDALATG